MAQSYPGINLTGIPRIFISPNPALVDVCLDIKILGLLPGQEVTLLSRVRHTKDRFYSYGYYTANGIGVVELQGMSCNGGTYAGNKSTQQNWYGKFKILMQFVKTLAQITCNGTSTCIKHL